MIALGSFAVMLGGQPAARMGDLTARDGVSVSPCCPTVIIGGQARRPLTRLPFSVDDLSSGKRRVEGTGC